MGKGSMAVAKASASSQETSVTVRPSGVTLKGALRTAVAVACVPAVVTKDLVCSFASSALQYEDYENYTRFGAGQYGVVTNCDSDGNCLSTTMECRENATVFDNYARAGFWAAVGLGVVLITSVSAATAYVCVRLRKKTQEANETEAARRMTTLERDFLQRKLDEKNQARLTPPLRRSRSDDSFDDIPPATYVNALRDGEGPLATVTFKQSANTMKDTYVDIKDGFEMHAEPNAWKSKFTAVKRHARDPLPEIPNEEPKLYQPVASFDDVPLASYDNVKGSGAGACHASKEVVQLKAAPTREDYQAKRQVAKQVQFVASPQVRVIPAREEPKLDVPTVKAPAVSAPAVKSQAVEAPPLENEEVGLAVVPHIGEDQATYAVVVKPEVTSAKISFHNGASRR